MLQSAPDVERTHYTEDPLSPTRASLPNLCSTCLTGSELDCPSVKVVCVCACVRACVCVCVCVWSSCPGVRREQREKKKRKVQNEIILNSAVFKEENAVKF